MSVGTRPINRTIYERLVAAARQQEPVTAGQVADLLGLALDYPPQREEMLQVIGSISRHEVLNGRPMLSALVIQKDGSGPGKGFYRLGRELGIVLDKEDELAFAVRQLRETFAYWSADSAPSVEQALAGPTPSRTVVTTEPPDSDGQPDSIAVMDLPADSTAPQPAPERPSPLVGNRAVEDAAVRWIMQLERVCGREPVDRRGDAAFPADISSPPRTIEVKAVGGSTRGQFLWIEPTQYDAAQRDPEYYVYVVENTRQGDPTQFTLKVLGGKQLHQLFARARQRHYYEIAWPVAHYDATPGLEALSERGAGAKREAR